jgi:hypothetical protein
MIDVQRKLQPRKKLPPVRKQGKLTREVQAAFALGCLVVAATLRPSPRLRLSFWLGPSTPKESSHDDVSRIAKNFLHRISWLRTHTQTFVRFDAQFLAVSE